MNPILNFGSTKSAPHAKAGYSSNYDGNSGRYDYANPTYRTGPPAGQVGSGSHLNYKIGSW
jgi:hypothetical protein